MIFKRKIYRELQQWKESDNGSTALLIKGARRVGKSTIAEEFARAEYDSYILIDFVECSDEVRICSMTCQTSISYSCACR